MGNKDFFANLFSFFSNESGATTAQNASSTTPPSPPASPRSPRSPRAKINNVMKSPIGSPVKFFRSHIGSPRFNKQMDAKNAACSSPEPKSPLKHDRFAAPLRPSPPASPVLNRWRQEKAPTSTPTALNKEPEFTVTEKVLGEGAFSQVKLATNKQTGQKVAVKSFSLPPTGVQMTTVQKENFAMLKKEREILAKMPAHHNVVKMHHSTEDQSGMNLYLQFVEGGDAYTWLCEHGRIPENVARPLFKQMVEAVAHCHEAGGVCHRDIKLENFLLDRTNMRPVLIDFGFASPIHADGIFRDFPGSPDYASPDILMGKAYNGVAADVYALGVLLYTMLYYRYPFHSENRSVMVRRVCNEEARFDPSVRVSAAGISLLSWMLKKTGAERPSIRQILSHPFFAAC